MTERCADDLIPTRKSLLDRLGDWDDNGSWKRFFDTYWKLIYGVALQAGLKHGEAEDVVQETFLAVAKNISEFEYDPGRCRFKSWLLTVTRSKIANKFQERGRYRKVDDARDESRTSITESAPDPGWERNWDEEWQKNLMDAAIERVKRVVSIEHFQMFDLFVLKGWRAREVAKTLGVSVAHVYVAKHRLTKLIRKEKTALEKHGI
jgi:RNA polymerase sigma factor (sigma-70 family)